MNDDMAVDYGLSEERIGRYIGSRRKEYYLATKCGCNPVDKGGKEDDRTISGRGITYCATFRK